MFVDLPRFLLYFIRLWAYVYPFCLIGGLGRPLLGAERARFMRGGHRWVMGQLREAQGKRQKCAGAIWQAASTRELSGKMLVGLFEEIVLEATSLFVKGKFARGVFRKWREYPTAPCIAGRATAAAPSHVLWSLFFVHFLAREKLPVHYGAGHVLQHATPSGVSR